jgi:anthranilate synthase component 1
MICDTVVAFDHYHRSVQVVSHVFVPGAEKAAPLRGEIERQYEATAQRIARVVALLQDTDAAIPLPLQPPIPDRSERAEAVSNIGKAGYEAHVTRLREHIVRGDIIQAVPSQRLSRPTALHPFNAYRHLRQVNPSPYMFYVDCGRGQQLVGASPECLCKVEAGKVYNHAIAGTIRRGKDAEGALDRLVRS